MLVTRRFVVSISAMAVAVVVAGAPQGVWAQSNATAQGQPARRSSLPEEALIQAREAEKHLASNQPDKAIGILRDLDKKHPGNPAISLRLAQIFDTDNRNGHALFYYRRYVQMAGQRARGMAVERVASLELMAGIDDDAEAAAMEIGENTAPIATPAPMVKQMLATQAKDGSLVPINSEEDVLKIQRQGVPLSAPATPVPTASPAIVIPPELTASRTPAPELSQYAAPPLSVEQQLAGSATGASDDNLPVSSLQSQVELASTGHQTAGASTNPPTRTQVSVYSSATPRPPDEDALLATAFRKADTASDISQSVEKAAEEPKKPAQKQAAPPAPVTSSPAPRPRSAPAATPNAADKSQSAPAVTPAGPPPERQMAFTKATPGQESPRAANFFNVSQGSSPQATVVVRNELESSVVTVSIIPETDAEAISAILMPGENKTLLVHPGTYDVSANASSTDYSPITLMNAEFKYTFYGNRQYTRRFNALSLQQLD